MAYSKEKKSEYNKRYYEEHRDQIYVTRKKWSMKNKERIDRQNKEYAETHRDQLRAYAKDYYHRHKDEPEFKKKQKEARDRYYAKPENREKRNAYARAYQKKLREKRKALEGQI